MRRVVFMLALLPAAAVLGACGGGDVVVQAQLAADSADVEPTPIDNLEVWLLPYDRDAIFDSLETAYPEPEPEIPDSLLALQDRVAEAQAEWSRIEAQWIEARDRLATLSDSMQGMDRSDAEYMLLFREFNQLQPEEDRLRRQDEAAFARFNELQNRFVVEAESIRTARDEWAAAAFAAIDSVIEAKVEEAGREAVADTTDATGTFARSLPAGQWWVHARYELPFSELYWNLPITVERGQTVQVRLSRENAEVRPNL